jgi:superfamily II DNA or RNA helicase
VTGFRRASADDVRRLIATTILGEGATIASDMVGRIELRAHQVDAAERLVAMIERNGGAMLAEPVGVGKTYTALAVAVRLGAARVVVAAPASLREMWTAAMRECELEAVLLTHEALSRGAAPDLHPDLVIVDESHRVRNPATRRYAAAAALCGSSRVLLVTATPVQNARADLTAQLALYLGRAAWTLTDTEIATHVVRGAQEGARSGSLDMPRLSGPHLLSLTTDDDCIDELLALPPSTPARDESTAAALLLYGLVHQWTSSRRALVAALERRVARGVALVSALETGRHPSRAELAAWTWSGEAVQLAFPEIVAGVAGSADDDLGELLSAVRAHQRAVGSLLERLRRAPNPDDDRAAAIRELRRRHPGERIIAFCHYAETVRALWSTLGRDAGVAALTASRARVAGGRVSRASVLEQFAPRGATGRETPRAERIDLLITTDVLSEGLNLQEASVVVHLDYPWNPARLDQRVGRVRRLGSRHGVVTVYALAPPASAERLLRIDERLRDKLRVAQRTIGVAGHILPSLVPLASQYRGAAEAASDIRERLRSWIEHGAAPASGDDAPAMPMVAALTSEVDGAIALVVQPGGPQLIADIGGCVDASPAGVDAALRAARGSTLHVDDRAFVAAIQRIDRWVDARCGASAVELPVITASRARRVALVRVAQALSRAPRHRRALLAPLAHAARSAAVAPLAEGAERVLDSLVASDLPDEAWLRSIAAFGELHARPQASRRHHTERGRVLALLLLVGSPG